MQASSALASDPLLPAAIPEPDLGALTPGTLLGGTYRLIRCISRGGMGDIHLASHEKLPGQVVVKVLSPDLVANQETMLEEALVRFRQEATVMANIRHPNVVQLLDFNLTPNGRPYLVMEHLAGQNLSDILATKMFSAEQVSSVVRQVACALDAAHRLGVVHRDLKPENIMVIPRPGQRDLVKVIDFGICKARRLNHLTSKGMVMGTPDFMSPEQAEGRHEDVEAQADQFALAVITYLLLVGRMPWVPVSTAEFIRGAAYQPPQPMSDDGDYGSVESVLFRALAKSPKDRYPSILAFSHALDGALMDAGLLPPPVRHLSPTPAQAGVIPPAASPNARVQTLSKQRRRGTQVGWAATALMVLMFGAYLASVGAPTVRERAGGGWDALGNFASRHVARGALLGHRLFSRASKASKTARVYLSSSP